MNLRIKDLLAISFVVMLGTVTQSLTVVTDPRLASNQRLYTGYLDQAEGAIARKDFTTLSVTLESMAQLDPIDTMESMMNSGPFSQAKLSTSFSPSQLEELGNSVFPIIRGGAESSATALLYATKGLEDDAFSQAATTIDQGFQTGNADLVAQGLQALASDPETKPLMQQLAKMANQKTYFEEELVDTLNPQELQQAGNILGLTTTEISEIVQQATIQNIINGITTAVHNNDVDSLVDLIGKIKSIEPGGITALLENGSTLDYETLSATFSLTDLSKIATAAGLSPSDVTLYVTGNYTSATAAANQFNTGSGINAKTLPNGSAYTDLSNAQSEIQKLGGITEAQEYIDQMQANVANWTAQLKAYQKENYDTTQLEEDIATAKSQIENLNNAIDVQTGITPEEAE